MSQKGSFSISSDSLIDLLSVGGIRSDGISSSGFSVGDGVSYSLFSFSSVGLNAGDGLLSTSFTVGLPLKSFLLSCFNVSLDASLNFFIAGFEGGLVFFSLFDGGLFLSFKTLFVSGSTFFNLSVPVGSGFLSRSHSSLSGSKVVGSHLFMSSHGSFSVSLDAGPVFILSSTVLFISKHTSSSVRTERKVTFRFGLGGRLVFVSGLFFEVEFAGRSLGVLVLVDGDFLGLRLR